MNKNKFIKLIYGYIFSSNSIINLIRRIYIEFRIIFRYMTVRKAINFTYNFIEIRTGRTRLNSMPPWVHIETTNRCNLKCPYCVGTGRPYNEKGIMSMEDFRSAVDLLAPTLIYVRLYNQGDPFMDPLLHERLLYLRKKKVSVVLSTNFSMYLGNEYLEKLVSLSPDHIVVCFESLNNDIYRKYRIGGDIETVKKNVTVLVKEKKRAVSIYPFISLRVFQTRYNSGEKKFILEYFRKSRADNILFLNMFVDMGNEKAVNEWLPPDSPLFNESGKVFCRELFNHPVINFRKQLVPCCAISDYSNNFGSFGDTDFMSAWNSSAYITARSIFISKKQYSGENGSGNICMQCRGIIKQGSISDHELLENVKSKSK